MSHAIYVRDIGRTRGSSPRLLAHAIDGRQVAQRIIHGIVRSYPTCGVDPISHVHWFRDAEGLHELWETPL